jgi:hypothetical protein
MIKSEANLVVEIWEHVRDSLPAGRRLEIAVGMLRSFVEFGFEKEDVADIIDEDDILSNAFNEVFDEGDEDYNDSEDEDSTW